MDNKNVFIAIALSMSVLLFWGALFENPNPVEKNINQKNSEKYSLKKIFIHGLNILISSLKKTHNRFAISNL